MQDKSTLEWYEYLIETVIITLIAMLWYKVLLFRCLPGMTCMRSLIFLLELLAVYITFGSLILFRYKKTDWTAVVSVLIPFGVYTALAYVHTVTALTKACLTAALIASAGYFLLIMFRKVSRPRYRRKIYKNRLYRCLCFSQTSIALAFLAVMIWTGIEGALGTDITNPSVEAEETDEYSQEQIISGNMDTILLLQEEEWDRLSLKERMEVMQCLADLEAQYLGLGHELNVICENLDGTTLACYRDLTHTICFSSEHIENDSAYDVANSLFHEAFHALQHRLVEQYNKMDEDTRNLLPNRRIAYYAEEFADYIYGSEDYIMYYYQYCEMDSRAYAEKAVSRYYDTIENYLNNGGEA